MIVTEFHEFLESCMIWSKEGDLLDFWIIHSELSYSTPGRAGRSGNGFVSIGCYEQSPGSSCCSSIGSTAGLWHETCGSCKTIVGAANWAIWWTWWLWRCQLDPKIFILKMFVSKVELLMIFMSETMFVFNLATLAIVEMSFLLASVAFRCVYCVYQCLPGPPRPPPAPPPPRVPKQDTKGMSRLSPRKRRDRKGKDGEKCVSMWCAQKKRAICKVVPFLDGVICIPYALRLWFHGSIFQARVSFGPFCVFKLPLLLETAHQTNIILQNLELSDALKQNYRDAQCKSCWFLMIYMTVYESLWWFMTIWWYIAIHI